MAVRVVQVRSAIGTKRDHRGTLRALGLGRIGSSALHEDTPAFRGMVHKIAYLLDVHEDASDSARAGDGAA